MRAFPLSLVVLAIIGLSIRAQGQAAPQNQGGAIRLIVRADDMGVCHAANDACIRSYREGIARSVEVIVPGQWFLEAARLCNENPALEVGVHLTLTSEWDQVKWRPITGGRSLVDADGFFHPNNRAFLDGKPDPAEVEKELRAQIELAKKHMKNVTHMSAHMYTPLMTPELRAVAEKLAREYNMPLESRTAKGIGHWWQGKDAAQKEEAFAKLIEKLQPGLWIFVEHPGADVPEMRSLGHRGYENVAEDREGVTRVFTSEKIKAIIQQRGIKLVGYAEAAAQKP